MLDAELLLAHLTEREFRYWQQIGEPIRVRAGETLVDVGDYPDLYLVLDGSFVMPSGMASPAVLGLVEFVTGWLTDQEWVADSAMSVFRIDPGRFGQVLATDPERKREFYQATYACFVSRILTPTNQGLPPEFARSAEKGVARFSALRRDSQVVGRFAAKRLGR